ncbi:MAG: hypothetical protein ACI9S9_001965 [Planctomycetota bacterium]|jgi:hypothetical protein
MVVVSKTSRRDASQDAERNVPGVLVIERQSFDYLHRVVIDFARMWCGRHGELLQVDDEAQAETARSIPLRRRYSVADDQHLEQPPPARGKTVHLDSGS